MFKKGVYIGGMHGIQRKTLVRFLRKIVTEPNGMLRSELFGLHTIGTAKFWDGIRDTRYPKGLYGLISEEKCLRNEFESGKYPRRWFITEAGREFLAAVERNPDAMPPENLKRERKLISPDARLLQREEKREAAKYQNNLEKWQRNQRRPKHASPNGHLTSPYAETPKNADIDINSPEFRRLPSLEKVRILRSRKAKESEPFFIEQPAEPWSAEELAELNRQLSGKPKPAPKPPESVPLYEPVPPKPLRSTLDEIADAKARITAGMSPEQLAEHERRVAELLKGAH